MRPNLKPKTQVDNQGKSLSSSMVCLLFQDSFIAIVLTCYAGFPIRLSRPEQLCSHSWIFYVLVDGLLKMTDDNDGAFQS